MIEIEQPIICEDVLPGNIRFLAASVIRQAVRDLTNRKKPFPERLGAFLWLTGPELQLWADAAGMDQIDPYKQLFSNLRKASRRLQERS